MSRTSAPVVLTDAEHLRLEQWIRAGSTPQQVVLRARIIRVNAEPSETSWMERELTGCQFADERLGKRFSMVLNQLAEGTAESISPACQDWANTKAAYRFFANERVR